MVRRWRRWVLAVVTGWVADDRARSDEFDDHWRRVRGPVMTHMGLTALVWFPLMAQMTQIAPEW